HKYMNKTKAIEILTKNQYKMTTRRETILDFFLKEDRYHTAKNLYDYMEERYPAISFDTVYRNLHLYHDLSILESTNLTAESIFVLVVIVITIIILYAIHVEKQHLSMFVR